MASLLPQIQTAAPNFEALPSAQYFDAPLWLRYWHLASFDAPTVAVVWSLAFAWVARLHVAPWVLALEALVVWAAYVADRLLDARQGVQRDGEGLRERHWFHWRHRHKLAPLAIAAVAVAAWIAVRWMPAPAWSRDSLVGAASLAYFARVHSRGAGRRILTKEMLVGMLFAAGCALPAWSRVVIAPAIYFAALAWLNCWAIERWENKLGGSRVARPAVALALTGAFAAVCALPLAPRGSALLVAGAASAALLAWLDGRRATLTPVMLRALADLVLLTPVLLWSMR